MKYKFGDAEQARKAYYSALNFYIDYKKQDSFDDDVSVRKIESDLEKDLFRVRFGNDYAVSFSIEEERILDMAIKPSMPYITSEDEFLIIRQATGVFSMVCSDTLGIGVIPFEIGFFVRSGYKNEKTTE